MSSSKSSPTTILLLLIIVFGAAMLVGQLRSRPTVALPKPLPEVNIQGWLNAADAITAEDLSGRWVVVDLWATWCPPCVASLPELVEFRQRWPEDEVLMVGITFDDTSAMTKLRETMEAVEGFDWPVAYGGEAAINSYGVPGIPTLILYDPAGQEVARAHSILQLEAIITVGVISDAPEPSEG